MSIRHNDPNTTILIIMVMIALLSMYLAADMILAEGSNTEPLIRSFTDESIWFSQRR